MSIIKNWTCIKKNAIIYFTMNPRVCALRASIWAQILSFTSSYVKKKWHRKREFAKRAKSASSQILLTAVPGAHPFLRRKQIALCTLTLASASGMKRAVSGARTISATRLGISIVSKNEAAARGGRLGAPLPIYFRTGFAFPQNKDTFQKKSVFLYLSLSLPLISKHSYKIRSRFRITSGLSVNPIYRDITSEYEVNINDIAIDNS